MAQLGVLRRFDLERVTAPGAPEDIGHDSWYHPPIAVRKVRAYRALFLSRAPMASRTATENTALQRTVAPDFLIRFPVSDVHGDSDGR